MPPLFVSGSGFHPLWDVFLEGLKGIRGYSPYTTLETEVGQRVKCIFDGEVTSVFNVEDTTAVLVKVGKFFIYYSNLSSVMVAMGQKQGWSNNRYGV